METIESWQDFYKNTKNKPPSAILIKGLTLVHDKEIALDLGAGSLGDTKYLISEGFKKVVAVDKEPFSPDALNELSKNNCEFVCSPFDKFKFLPKQYDLINAQYSLPFNPPETFNTVWDNLKNSLKTSGVFVGQFFGIHDEWNSQKRNMTFHTKNEITLMLTDMEIVELQEEEKDGHLANGAPKHWHVFHVIAVAK